MFSVIHSLFPFISRSDNVKENKGKNVKRKREGNEPLADESAAVSSEGGSDKAKKRKKKTKH